LSRNDNRVSTASRVNSCVRWYRKPKALWPTCVASLTEWKARTILLYGAGWKTRKLPATRGGFFLDNFIELIGH
jgi:hypothetical protein